VTEALSLTNIVVSFDETEVLKGVNLTVEAGEFGALLGPSGCGKTTLLRTIAGLERPSSGELRIGMKMLSTHGIYLAPEKRNIGWVPQDAALFPHLTVAENIAFGLARSASGVRKQAKSDRVSQLLELVGLSLLAARMPHELSGGQAQRVALARALANKPAVVLLDEPFAGLDPILRAELRVEIKEILRAQETTSLLVTHDQEEALSLADRIAIMNEGVIQQVGSPAEVYNTPASLWCAEFMGETNVLDGTVAGDRVHTFLGESSVRWMGEHAITEKERIRVMLRPESLTLRPGSDFTVDSVNFAGHDALVTVRDERGNRLSIRIEADHLTTLENRVDVEVTGLSLAYPAV